MTMNIQMPTISVVVPVYKEEKNVPEFLNRVVNIFDNAKITFEIIFAMDPSPDRTEEVIRAAHQKDARIKLITFSRRFGQPMATIGGMQYANGNGIIVMDVDLQDPPELIIEMINKWQEGFDIVYAQRRKRDGESILKKVISAVGYKIINRIAEVTIPPNTGDFRLMSRRAVVEILKLKESHGFLRGLVALVGFKQTSVLFDRPARFSGDGNYNRYFGSLKIGFNGIFCFSNVALVFATSFGFTIASIALIVGLVYLAMKLVGFPFPLGNPTVVILVLFLGGIQLITIGILGEYIGRIYDEVKQRPKYIIDQKVGL